VIAAQKGEEMRQGGLLIAGMLLLVSGCVHTNATMLGGAQPRRVVRVEEVAIYRTAAQVPGKYEEIALLHSKGASSWTNEPQMFESMKVKAAEVGANAIILDAISEPSAGAKIAGAFLGYEAERQGKAIAVYVHGGAVSGVVFPPPVAAQPVAAQQPLRQWTAENPTSTVDTQLRNLDREFRAGRIGVEEYRKLKKVLQPEE
jgi:hypothetical protein